MPQVVRSTINMESPQRDGRRWVHLRHELDDGSFEESSTLIDDSTTPVKLKNARVKAIEERPPPPEPDAFLVKLDAARDAYLSGDLALAESTLSATVEVKR